MFSSPLEIPHTRYSNTFSYLSLLQEMQIFNMFNNRRLDNEFNILAGV